MKLIHCTTVILNESGFSHQVEKTYSICTTNQRLRASLCQISIILIIEIFPTHINISWWNINILMLSHIFCISYTTTRTFHYIYLICIINISHINIPRKCCSIIQIFLFIVWTSWQIIRVQLLYNNTIRRCLKGDCVTKYLFRKKNFNSNLFFRYTFYLRASSPCL